MSNPVLFQDIQDVFDSFLLMKDRDFIRLTMATVIGNQMHGRRPVWLMLVAPPSSGKTTALNALIGLKVFNRGGEAIEPIASISDLTENSFASGAKSSTKETSLLFKMPMHGGMMVFKDFTSVLSKSPDSKRIIMAQLREIYDGSYVKRTGTGDDIMWTGHLGALAGVTESVYQHLESMSVMGDRFMLYQIPQPDRKEMLRFKLKQEREGKTEDVQMPLAKELVHSYMQRAFSNLTSIPVNLGPEREDQIIAVADFCTMVRSGIITNEYTGDIQFVPQPEMPARMFEQMLTLGSTFSFMRKLDDTSISDADALTIQDLKVMNKIAYDSIPITRRIALNFLVRYSSGVDTTALAVKINYPSKVVQAWLEQLNALGVVRRQKNTRGTNTWRLNDEHLRLMEMLQGVQAGDGKLTDDDVDANMKPELFWEREERAEVAMLSPDQIRELEENDSW